MARIAGVDLPKGKRIDVALRYIYGIGSVTSRRILDGAGIDGTIRVKHLTEGDVSKINTEIIRAFHMKHYTSNMILFPIKA